MVKSEYTGIFRSDKCKRFGTFTCGGCPLCRYMNTQSKFTLPNGRIYRPRHYANCKTSGVIYLLTCQCKCFYVGKTKLEFHKRAARHITTMRQANPDLPLGRHVRDHHAGISPSICFTILDWVHPDSRGGDWNKILLQREVR